MRDEGVCKKEKSVVKNFMNHYQNTMKNDKKKFKY